MLGKNAQEIAGFDCIECGFNFTSSQGLLEHKTSKLHLQTIGFSKKKTQSSVDSIKSKIKQLAEAKKLKSQKKEYDLDSTLAKRKAEKDLAREEKKKKKEERKKADDPEINEEMKAMGFDFSSFGKSKK